MIKNYSLLICVLSDKYHSVELCVTLCYSVVKYYLFFPLCENLRLSAFHQRSKKLCVLRVLCGEIHLKLFPQPDIRFCLYAIFQFIG